jgi:hypothetical protein
MGSQAESRAGLFSARNKPSMQQYCVVVLDEGKHVSHWRSGSPVQTNSMSDLG